MNEFSTFMDGEDCRDCASYEKAVLRLERELAEAREMHDDTTQALIAEVDAREKAEATLERVRPLPEKWREWNKHNEGVWKTNPNDCAVELDAILESES